MWLVLLALKRPYTFLVMAIFIVILGTAAILRMPTDIFPEIDIPVISVVWNYSGLPPEEIEERIETQFERGLTTTVNDIEHVESQALNGMSIMKIFFQPGASIQAATAQVTAIAQTSLRQMPPGMTPPFIIQYSASNVPIMQIALESEVTPEQQLFDLAQNYVRADLAVINGTQVPYPYGGKQRTIIIDVDPQRLFAWGLSPRDVTNAVASQNVILPTGTAKMGTNEYPVLMNSSPEVFKDLGDIPLKTVRGATVFVRDVATVRDGYSPQTNIVHVSGKRSVLLSVLKHGTSSTLEIASRIREAVPSMIAKLPKDVKVDLLFDQSIFVRAAVEGVVKEAAIAAALTGIMIFLFLGSWRSTVVVVVSIPLSILVAIVVLYALGESLNVMTLGGMALAVGILVDDATVAIENIHRNMAKRSFLDSIVEGTREIAVPAFVSTLCICIVFVPVALITGAAKSLFIPMALSVVFAMMMSYFLSRTLVPTMVRYLLRVEYDAHQSAHGPEATKAKPKRGIDRLLAGFERAFERLRSSYGRALAWALANRARSATAFLVFALGSVALFPLVGRDFFPSVDAGLIKLHVRGPPGQRIEETERRFTTIAKTVRDVIPASEIEMVIDNLGVPYSGLNLSLSEGVQISPADGQVLVALKEHHGPTADHVRHLRRALTSQFPDTTFFFLAPDISTQVLNFGVASPIDVQIVSTPGNDEAAYDLAKELAARVKKIPGAVDVRLAQVPRQPELRIDVDRSMAQRLGMTQKDVANDILTTLSSSSQVNPSYWLDTKRGIQYPVAVQTPQYFNHSIEALDRIPLSTGETPQFLSNVATITRATGPANITHYNAARTFDVQLGVDGTDLGTVANAVKVEADAIRSRLPRGATMRIKGQVESMESSFRGLGYGIIFAVLLVYLVMVVNFQSWLDPFVILTALPGALAGIAWMLFLTGTTLSVPALMGAIMCVGVATANSILVVTFANDQRAHGRDSTQAALAAGMTRLRPVMMTALAMIIGMLPMALGIGEGAEQNAPLGRAVIGGLLVATFSTLFFVPTMYSLLRRAAPRVDEEVAHL